MKTVGLKALKARLNELINRCRAGELVIITDRGQEVAVLAPLNDPRRPACAKSNVGQISKSGSKPKGLRGIKARGGSVAQTVINDRR